MAGVMDKLIILDDVFDEATTRAIAGFDYGAGEKWYELGANPAHDRILDICRVHFDLSQVVGYEMWRNARMLDRHTDKHEKIFLEQKRHVFPQCTAVYYAVVENVNGGEFFTDDVRFFPRANRLVLFSPGIYHGVAAYTGTRIAVSLNPWTHRV